MALGTPTHRGSAGTRNSSGTSRSVSPNATLAAGTEVFVRAAFDNNSLTSGETDDLSIADSVGGNTWIKVWEFTETSGGANDGTTCALFKSRLTNAIGTSDTITVTTDSAVSTRLVAVDSVTSDNPLAWETITPGTHTQGDVDGDIDLTFTYSGLTSREYLSWFIGSFERASGGWVIDSDYTELTLASTSGGAQATNQTSFCGYRIATMTGDVFTYDVNADAEYVGGLVFFYEDTGNVVGEDLVAVYDTFVLVAEDLAAMYAFDGNLGEFLPPRLPESTGTTYYVDKDHPSASDSNPGTAESAPWATVGKAFDSAPDNSIVRVVAGATPYAETIVCTRGGSDADNVITVEAYDPVDPPVILGQVTLQGVNAAFWRLRNLVFDADGATVALKLTYSGGDSNAANVGVHDVEVEGCEARNTIGAGACYQVTGSSCHDIQFWGCLGLDADPALTTAHGWYLNGGSDMWLVNCVARDNGGYGYHCYNGSGTQRLKRVYFHNCLADGDILRGGWLISSDATQANAEADPTLLAQDIHLYNCLSTNHQGVSTSHGYRVRYGSLTDFGATGATPSTIENCLSYNNNSGDTSVSVPTDSVVIIGLITAQDPLYVASGSDDFHLQTGSPAYDAGLLGYTPTIDFDGNTRSVATLGPYRAPEEATGVSADLASVYDVRAFLNESLAAVYDARAFLNESLAAVYDVRVFLDESLVAVYDAFALASEDLAAIWDVRAFLAEDAIVVYDVRAFLAESLVAVYDTFVLATEDLLSNYAVVAFAAASLIAQFDVRAFSSKDLVSVYDTFVLAVEDLAALYDVLELASEDLLVLYDTFVLATGDVVPVYDVFALVAGELIAVYDLRSFLAEDLLANYAVLVEGVVGTSLVAVYDARAFLSEDLVSVYDALIFATENLAALYDVLELASEDLLVLYDTFVLATGDVVPVYDVFALAAGDLAAVYDTFVLSAEDLAAVYDLRAVVGDDLIANYAVLAVGVVGTSLIAVYDLRATMGASLIAVFDARSLAGVSLDISYDVVARALANLIATYEVFGQLPFWFQSTGQNWPQSTEENW